MNAEHSENPPGNAPTPSHRLTRILSLATQCSIMILCISGAWWIYSHKSSTPKSEKPPAAATVPKIAKEDELNTVSLTDDAIKRIGLAVSPITKKSLPRVRVYRGEVTIPVGHLIPVAAPIAGTIQVPGNKMPIVGQPVKAGQPIYHLIPLLSPDARATLSASLVDAEGQVANAKSTLDLAKTTLDRASKILREGAGSQRQVDEAQTAFELADKTLAAANSRYTVIKRAIGDADTGAANPIPLIASQDGLLRTVSVQPGQNVQSGAALFEIMDLSTVWVRVALPVGDLDRINRSESAQIGKLSVASGVNQILARPIAAPPSANPLAATVDQFYILSNSDGKLTPGQLVGVSIPLSDSRESLTLPWSAIVFDINGGTWVYEELGTRKFTRRRVTIDHTAGNDAVLASGPVHGTKIVTVGAQELFGAETGFIK